MCEFVLIYGRPPFQILIIQITEGYDNAQIKSDFNELYQQMNGMPLREMDKIVYPVCKLCRDHEKAGFVEGIKIGVWLAAELKRQ